MEPESILKTAFISQEEFNIMSFGLYNISATFQYAMDNILEDYNWKFAMVYIDNINTVTVL